MYTHDRRNSQNDNSTFFSVFSLLFFSLLQLPYTNRVWPPVPILYTDTPLYKRIATVGQTRTTIILKFHPSVGREKGISFGGIF